MLHAFAPILRPRGHSSSFRDGTLIAAVCPGLIDTAASRPWFTDMSPHSLPDCVQSSDIV
jgi:hypothetical protein